MGSEVFRFVTVHPPAQLADLTAAAAATIDLGLHATPFADSLRAMRLSGSRTAMTEAAEALVTSDDFVSSIGRLPEPYGPFLAAVRLLPEANFRAAAEQAFTAAFQTTPQAYAQTAAFKTAYTRTSDSIVAAAMVTAVPVGTRALLVEVARALGLIRQLAAAGRVTRSGIAEAPLTLPSGIFPLPEGSAHADVNRTADRTRPGDGDEPNRTRLAAELTAHRQAVDELLDAFAAGPAQPVPASAGRTGFALADAAAARLSSATREILDAAGLADGPIDVVKAVGLLERRSAGIARRLYGGGLADPGGGSSPGLCAPAPAAELPTDTVTVPTGHGEAKVLGIADLMVVEQELLRYELGEVGHIENVLRGETRKRTFKTSATTEQTLTTETETTEEKSQDLSSAERFELQTESQTVINETASKSAGLTIHASYGPTVDATSNFNYASSSSRAQSASAAASFAREVTSKAASRVETRTLTRRTVRTVHTVEESNEHGFDNNSNNDIVGVYRYVDKTYRAQVVNYGKRLMLEFLVPEPAAFLRHAMTHRPLDGVTAPKPQPPGYCLADGTTFVPLQAEHITRENYLYWASTYGARDVSPPPPSLVLASGAKKSPDSLPTDESGDRKIGSDLMDVAIPEGYLCQSAFVNLYGETQAGAHQIVYQVQDQQREYVEPPDDGSPFLLHLQPTPTLTVTINSLGFYNYEVLVTVLCQLAPEKFQAWQLATFHAIMNAYEEARSRYDQQVAEARLQARDDTIAGINPARNREIEQMELRKGCLSLLTGQRFDLFDAVGRNVAPYGYPEVDFAEAQAEGPYIQAFEQSFEWHNLTYVLYPYFWGNKQEWPDLALRSDDDPLFARFLAAGAARVQVPVRLGFEARVLTYLATGELWTGDGVLVNSESEAPDPHHLSILEELKSQLGDNTVRGPGTVTVTKNSVTVTGDGTEFRPDDEDRRIRIGGKTYQIKTVVDPQTIRLTAPYPGDTGSGLGYSLGGRLVGEPWEVKLPTNLVKLDSSLVIN